MQIDQLATIQKLARYWATDYEEVDAAAAARATGRLRRRWAIKR